MKGGTKLTKVKEIQGTLKKSRIKNNPDTPILLSIDPPEQLSDNAKEIWNDVKVIIEAGVVKIEHVSMLALFCNELAWVWEIEGVIRDKLKDKPMGEDEKHDRHMRLLLTTQKEKMQNAIRIGQDYGLTPISGQRIDIATGGSKKKDPFDD